MKAYVYGARRDLPQGFEDFTTAARSAIVSIDMHQGHLADTPDCPCPAPRAREIVAPIDAFHAAARAVGVPVVHVKSVLRKGGVDDTAGIPSAWRRTLRPTPASASPGDPSRPRCAASSSRRRAACAPTAPPARPRVSTTRSVETSGAVRVRS